MLASIFKTIYLKTSNVRFGSFFQNPVTYTALILLLSLYFAFMAMSQAVIYKRHSIIFI